MKARAAAKERGEPFYFSETACRRGHRTQRRTSNGQCQECLGTWLAPEGQWLPKLYVPFKQHGITRQESARMTGRLYDYAAAILADVRSGQLPLTSEELVTAVTLALAIRGTE